MPLLDYFYVLQFENNKYLKLFKLDDSGYLTSDDLTALLNCKQCMKLLR